ncbi:HTTM domain-containing protein [Rhodocytophaga rosea]|uniref:HTTM domain-containing protein n=1 Tax=Rhodocytophaga rosea TaxID=2704465 RepID=A0A6C0GP96_9BACT|nr:HTTM domain-containing protein [Rhodocytophaga rosea]QHT69402.1 HTTM domain-containing protein [Rhodocytophaga rosea]
MAASLAAYRNFLFERVDNSPLIVFRMVFGLLIFLESGGAILTGWVKETFIDPTIHFTFIGFEWLRPLPGYGMHGYYALMAVLGLMVMLGLFYRFSIVGFTLLWWASYLMQKDHYNNHYYLLILLCLLMMVVPAHHYASLDTKRNPSIRQLTCSRWCIWIFILQFWIVFTYAAIAKMQPDWMNALPVGLWFSYKTDYPIIGPLLGTSWIKWVVAYGGILFDFLVIPLLIWKRTRLLALAMAIVFHLFNSAVFQIGIFPYLMIGASVFFFPGETIRRLFLRRKPVAVKEPSIQPISVSFQNGLILLFSVYFILQILLPLRHLLYPGDVNWTEEGHRMSWRMMLRSKAGSISFTIKDPASDKSWEINPSEYLTDEQISSLSTHPDMVWQFVQYLKKKYAAEGIPQIEVYAHSLASLNGRPFQPFIDENVDLAKVDWAHFSPSIWILPLQTEDQQANK